MKSEVSVVPNWCWCLANCCFYLGNLGTENLAGKGIARNRLCLAQAAAFQDWKKDQMTWIWERNSANHKRTIASCFPAGIIVHGVQNIIPEYSVQSRQSTLTAWKILLFPLNDVGHKQLCKLCRAWTAVHQACFSAHMVAKLLMLSCQDLWQVEMLILRRDLCPSCSARNNSLLMCLFLGRWLVTCSQEHHQFTVFFITNFWSWLLLNRRKLHPSMDYP